MRKPVQVEEHVKMELEDIKGNYGFKTESQAIEFLLLAYQSMPVEQRLLLQKVKNFGK
jgi:hypothetical protein